MTTEPTHIIGPLIRLDKAGKQHRLGHQVVQALSGISLEIERGEFVAVMGPSGSGKSTLLSILGCLDRPTCGSYFFGNEDVVRLSRDRISALRNRHIGFVFQNFNLLPHLTAVENVALPLFYRRERLRNPALVARMALERVGLGGRIDHLPAQLSGGEQQRVAIARAIVNGPEMLLADEPTGALDTVTRDAILGLLGELHRAGLAVLLVTHDQEIAAHAQRIVKLRDGRIVGGRQASAARLPSEAAP